jgi:hypothetical protein
MVHSGFSGLFPSLQFHYTGDSACLPRCQPTLAGSGDIANLHDEGHLESGLLLVAAAVSVAMRISRRAHPVAAIGLPVSIRRPDHTRFPRKGRQPERGSLVLKFRR